MFSFIIEVEVWIIVTQNWGQILILGVKVGQISSIIVLIVIFLKIAINSIMPAIQKQIGLHN